MRMKRGLAIILSVFALAATFSCKNQDKEKEARATVLYQAHCARCHVGPDIESLPKSMWAERVLPDMAARMGIKEGDFDPFKGMGFEEKEIVMKAGVYPYAPLMSS